ncbi:MAG: RIP metalloprotease RseP, partial [Gemmatimonadales bacterium]
MSFLFTLLVLAVVLGVLVFVHEAGHFLAAKAAGIHVHRFSLGLGSPIPWLTFTRGGTEYSISWLPLGGYVKMATAEEEATSSALEGGAPTVPVPPDRMFEAKPIWKRMVVILAGVTMNALFGWAAYTYLAATNGRAIDPETRIGRVVTTQLPAGAGPLAALAPGDRIVAVAGKPVNSWGEVINGFLTANTDSIRVDILGRAPVVLDLHRDALEERQLAAFAILPYRTPVVDRVTSGSPAAAAGLAPGDTVLAIQGTPVDQWYDLTRIVEPSIGTPLSFELARGGRRVEVTISPVATTDTSDDGKPRQIGRIGVTLRSSVRREPLT